MNMTFPVFYFPNQDLGGEGGGGVIFFALSRGLGCQKFCMMLAEVVGRYEKIMAIKKYPLPPCSAHNECMLP